MLDMLDDKIIRSIYVSRSVIEGFAGYAKKTSEGVSYHLEQAFIEYMENHPLEGTPIIIQNQIKSDIVDKLKMLQISLIEKPLRLYMTRLTSGDGNADFLRKNISKEVKKGIKIKNPSPEFLALLMEAEELI